MDKFIVVTIETEPEARARRLAYERNQGGHVFLRPDGSHVLVRPDGARWPPYSDPQPVTNTTGWTELT